MLKVLFEWFDTHAQSYWVIATIPTLVLAAWMAWQIFDAPPPDDRKSRRIVFAVLVLFVLFAWRWPFLLSADEYNPDESQLIAGAMTLRLDAVPWRGVDGFTSGPLNFYPLTAIQLCGLPLDYFTARVTALLLIWGALLACYHLWSRVFDSIIASVCLLPALAFFSTVTDWDFIHYSSEHLALLLTAVSAYGILRPVEDVTLRTRWRIFGCLCAGMLPLAKLQSGPLAAALVVLALISERREISPEVSKKRVIALRLFAAALPTVFIVGLAGATGQFEHFLRSYLLQNFVYVGDGASLAEVIENLWSTSHKTDHFLIFCGITTLGACVGAPICLRSKPKNWWWISGALIFAASLVSIFGARRALLHYVLLCIVPLVLWYGAGVGSCLKTLSPRPRLWLSSVFLLIGLAPFGFRLTQKPPDIIGTFGAQWREPYTAVGRLLRSYKSPESRLAIWGWLPSLYVESGLPQATRDGNTSWAMIPSPHREYYQQRFLADLRRTHPDFFVDAVGVGSRFFSDRGTAGHESFPALASYISQNYQLVTDAGYLRLYLRNALPRPPLPEDMQRQLQMKAVNLAPSHALRRESISPQNLPTGQTRTGSVQMMHPPAEIVWSLDNNTREIIFEYGFLPEAYRQNRTDGVELIFELHSSNVPIRHLFYRFLDPVRRSADRGPVTARLILPPFKPGARLVARTTPGPAGDGAWDWVYLGRVSPVSLPVYSSAQFPNFNRVPDTADADLSYLLDEAGKNLLILHAPALLTYQLSGKERRLRFDYGFKSGAYSKGGQTDGATFKVELHSAAGLVRILFEKELAPTGQAADRATHSANLVLPTIDPADKLLLRIDPGAGNAWDWTFITNLVLE